MKKLYKILVDSKSCHGGDLTWSLPKKDGKKWIPGDWHKVDTVKICNSGLHLTDKPYTWYKWGCSCYEAEVKGEPIWEDNKCVVGEARLLKVVPHPKWWNDCVGWVNTLKSIAWLKPDCIEDFIKAGNLVLNKHCKLLFERFLNKTFSKPDFVKIEKKVKRKS